MPRSDRGTPTSGSPCSPFSPPATSVPSWDAGRGSRKATVSVAEHYDSVVATYVSDAQLGHASAHPKVRYLHKPEGLSEDNLIALADDEG
ncbi:unnamed protein product [Triticum turgidum subsp. durum]|uniref:Uncharacterized protein n=1 Tax=Triticum turgidum subsp. durum TaxID=4567 RepID=A0A9R1P8A3_TRITD|nr:unnamed protein product [Triticum turgidum subsp. durum]